MAAIRGEVFVSKDDLNYTKLDLLKDENIIIKYLRKDTKDLSKVFAPFSNGFSVGATEKNMQAFGFFGKTEVIRLSGSNILKCKIYVNGFLNNIGLLKIENVKYDKGRASSFNVSFNSSVLSLKDRIGDDKISDLNDIFLDWSAKYAYNSIKNTQTVSDIVYYTPLISNNRVLSYDADNSYTDNVAYFSGSSPLSDRVINAGELRPAVSLLSLFRLIKDKYDLQITMPLESRAEFKEAFIWCNGSNFESSKFEKLTILNQFNLVSSGSFPVTASADLTNSSIAITRSSNVGNTFNFDFDNVYIVNPTTDTPAKMHLLKKSNGATLAILDFNFTSGSTGGTFNLSSGFYIFDASEFYVYLECEKQVRWSAVNFSVGNSLGTDSLYTSTNNNNALLTNFGKVNLLKGIPETKVMDFLTYIIKTFNISIFDSSVNDENLDFLTQEDIDNEIAVYGKNEADYTRFADLTKVDKKVLEEITYYNFKHKTSKYKSNVDFKNQFNIEYGQITYPTVKPAKAKEYIIESGFSIIPPVTINGLPSVYTCYGFTNSAPKIEGGLFRYTPNLDELTIFYKGNSISMPALGCQNINTSNVLITSSLDLYQPSTPFNLNNGYSLGFSILVNNSVSFPLSLYYNYYRQQTELLLNPNTLEHAISFDLPPQEIYLNENIGFKPIGFRLQNDVIVSETKYEIVDMEINLITGDTKGKLLNK